MPKSFRQNSELSLPAFPPSVFISSSLLLQRHLQRSISPQMSTKTSQQNQAQGTLVGEVCVFDACVCCAHVGVWGLFVFLFQHMIYSVCLLGCLRESRRVSAVSFCAGEYIVRNLETIFDALINDGWWLNIFSF